MISSILLGGKFLSKELNRSFMGSYIMRVVLAGSGSAVGKTTISTGIMKALSSEGVQPFKVGPDYIDPSYHTVATGNPSRNLDSFFMSEGQIREAFIRGMEISNARMGVIEGVRGLYEGISSVGDVGSTASIAKALNAPVVLIINSRSLVKSAAALVLGFKTLDPKVKIEGVILNQVKNRRHYLKAKKAIEKLSYTRVIGGIPRREDLKVEQRHLGLVPTVERENLKFAIEKWGNVVEEYIDLDELKNIMKDSGKIKGERETLWQTKNRKKVKIGIAYDEAFNFYYIENLEALEDNRASLYYFSPIHDEEIPDVDGIYIGGGYPEIFAEKLEKNASMKNSIRRFHEDEKPIFGECGGLLYLSRSLDGYEMCNIFSYRASMTRKVQGLSYVIAKSERNNIISPRAEIFKGHEFHYSNIHVTGNPRFAFKIQRGKGIKDGMDGLVSKKTLASYIHIHAASCPTFAATLTSNALEQ